MLTKAYGRFLLESLPACPVEVRRGDDAEELLAPE